jgi:anti-sigma B factor antagonist
MQLKIEDKNGVAVCAIMGDIDINSSPELKKSFDQIIKAKKDKVLVNFSGVDYVDSSGLATLVEILKNMRSFGGKLKLAALSQKVLGLFEITKLNKLFDIASDEQEGLNSF